MSKWSREMRSMLGKEVTVTLSHEPVVTQSGTLHGFDENGEVTLCDDTGTFHWCWPNLNCVVREE